MDAIFPDNTVLINFACIQRLDLLRDWLRGRGRWTEAVAFEAANSAAYWPGMAGLREAGWLGEPIEPDPNSNEAIDRMRRNIFGGSRSQPLKHLGESQTCYLLRHESELSGSWWVSDDQDAVEFAQRQGITTRRTIDIFMNVVADGDLTSSAAFDLMHAIADRDRSLELPKTHADLR